MTKKNINITTEELKKLNEQLSSLTAKELLAWFVARYPGKTIFSSSMGLEDQVITDLLASLSNPVPVFTLDTGRMFPETYDLIDITRQRYNIVIEVWFPDGGQVRRMVGEHGINLFYSSQENRKLCCHIRKTEPLRQALSGYSVWITGLRREQSAARQDLELVSFDPEFNILKVNPLLNWSTAEVWEYIRLNRVPYNTLHDQGYPSIGCQPCTRAVMEGEDIRAGRWWWEESGKKECGLHDPLKAKQKSS